MQEDDLNGTLAIVSPALWTSGRSLQTGTVTSTNLANKSVSIAFEDGEQQNFHPAFVFLLRPPESLYELVALDRQGFSERFQDLIRITALLQCYRTKEHLQKAFAMVAEDPELFRWTTIRVSDSVEPENRRKIGR